MNTYVTVDLLVSKRPVAILLGTSYQLAAQFDSEYWPFFWWMCMWTALLHLITAMIGYVIPCT